MTTTAANSGYLGDLMNIRQQPLSIAAEPSLKRLAEANSGDVKEIAASQIELLARFYDLSLSQASRSFRWALIASIAGLIFFLAALVFMAWKQDPGLASISVISGAMVQVIGGINFWLYSRTISQLTLFQSRLEVTQRFLLANSLCESLEGDLMHKTRAKLIGRLVGVRMGRDDEADLDSDQDSGQSGEADVTKG